LFADADQARRTADALHAHAIEPGPWASCRKVALGDDAHQRALSIAGPATKKRSRA
jgi:hypothetical protein